MAGRARRPGSVAAALLVTALLARDAASQDELDVTMRVVDDPSTVVAVLIVIDVPPPEQERAADEAGAAASPAPSRPTDAETDDGAPADSPPERAAERAEPGSDGE
jgi:hypothetical protein